MSERKSEFLIVLFASTCLLDKSQSTGLQKGRSTDAAKSFFFINSFKHAVLHAQVAYPGDNVTIPLSMTNPALPVPSFIAFEFTALEGDLSFLPRNAAKGILQWNGGASDEPTALIHLPIHWDEVPLWAEYR